MKSSHAIKTNRDSNFSLRQIGTALSAVALLAVTGCGIQPATNGPAPLQLTAFHGHVHGGQQPVTGSTIQLVEAGTSGYGNPADNTLLHDAVVSDANGNFNITGDYTCHTGSDQVYLVATGGNPGIAGTHNNSALALMAAAGRCDQLPNIPFVAINELSTVAAVWAASPFMTSLYAMSTSSANTLGLSNAFAAANRIVSLGTGAIGGPGLPAGATLPVNEINTLADILAACVNSVDDTKTSALSGTCQNLFSATTVAGATPANTVQAALNLAHNPTLDLALSSTATGTAPFQPTLTTPPTSWTIAIQYTGGGLSNPQGVAIDAGGNVWAPNRNNNSASKFDTSGTPLSGNSGFTAGLLNLPSAIAIDVNGNAWIANAGNSTLSKVSGGGESGTAYAQGGLNIPKSIAIDAAGNIWLANSGANSVSEFSATGAALSGSSGFTGNGLAAPVGIVVDPK